MAQAREMFSNGLPVTRPIRRAGGLGIGVSTSIHVLAAGVVLAAPIILPEALPDTGDAVRAFFYDPPPPPPPITHGVVQRTSRQVVIPETPSEKALEMPNPTVQDSVLDEEPEEFGAEDGGVAGGIAGGVVGGVVGGTGTDLNADIDRGASPLKVIQPRYPQDAFDLKIEGVVELEIFVSATGKVEKARVIRSIPLLDAAALEAVYQLVFAPALRHGRPVPSIVRVPVRFKIH